MNLLTVLLVEDDPAACNAFTAYADMLEDVEIVYMTNGASDAIDAIRDYRPDAVILDLELHQGSGSGLDVLRSLKEAAPDITPFVLITTNNSSPVTYEYARQMGADYILAKHQENYSEKEALDLLRMMREVIQSRRKAPNQMPAEDSPRKKEQRLRRRIMTELNHVGVSSKMKGYQYLIDGILLIIEAPQQHLCNVIGQKYGKTEASVERAMQNAIDKAWKTADIDDLLRHFDARISSEKGVPTITEFVYYYANQIKNDL